MKVDKLMTKEVITVEMDDSLGRVNEIFNRTGFHHLLVVESGKLFGVVSDRDLLKTISPKIGTVAASDKDLASLNKKVHQIMTRKPIFLNTGASVHDAIEIFNNSKISCIPITDSEAKPVGILSWRDIMKALGKRDKRP